MKTLPAAVILEKNKIATGSAWLILLKITLPDSTVLRFVRNNEDIVFGGETYSAFPFEIEPIEEQLRGQIPSVSLKISNVTRLIQAYLETFDGGLGSTVLISVVNSEHLSEDYTELDLSFEVINVTTDAKWVIFTLGIPNPLNKRFPLHRYVANHCNWVSRFKGAECQYAGEVTACTGTLSNCRLLNNSEHFGGFIGLDKGGFRFA